MRVFLDTNVLASAVATRGLCADVLQTALAEHEIVISEQILTEMCEARPMRILTPRGFWDLLRSESAEPT